MLSLGFNNLKSDGVDQVIDRLDTLIQITKEKHPAVNIYLCTVPQNPRMNNRPETDKLNDHIRVLCHGDSRIHVINLAAGISEQSLLIDQIHPNTEGLRVVEKLFRAALPHKLTAQNRVVSLGLRNHSPISQPNNPAPNTWNRQDPPVHPTQPRPDSTFRPPEPTTRQGQDAPQATSPQTPAPHMTTSQAPSPYPTDYSSPMLPYMMMPQLQRTQGFSNPTSTTGMPMPQYNIAQVPYPQLPQMYLPQQPRYWPPMAQA